MTMRALVSDLPLMLVEVGILAGEDPHFYEH